jgi:hypothetical protein
VATKVYARPAQLRRNWPIQARGHFSKEKHGPPKGRRSLGRPSEYQSHCGRRSFRRPRRFCLPSAGRAIDRIAFEIKDLECFCKKLSDAGIKFDSPYQVVPQLKLSAAFLADPSGARIELTEGLAH